MGIPGDIQGFVIIKGFLGVWSGKLVFGATMWVKGAETCVVHNLGTFRVYKELPHSGLTFY